MLNDTDAGSDPSMTTVEEGSDPGKVGHQSLRSSQNFRRVLRDGARSREGGIVMVGSPGPSGQPRLGLVVSKQCGSAVTRNRIKRRLRHAAKGLDLQPGNDYVIIASGQVARAPYSEIEEWLARALAELDHA